MKIYIDGRAILDPLVQGKPVTREGKVVGRVVRACVVNGKLAVELDITDDPFAKAGTPRPYSIGAEVMPSSSDDGGG